MNEWKNLEIDNLPPDILTGDYEFERLQTIAPYFWEKWECSRPGIIHQLVHDKKKYRYRLRPQKKTVQEMAEGYADEYYNDLTVATVKQIATDAYIAGYKAKEAENDKM